MKIDTKKGNSEWKKTGREQEAPDLTAQDERLAAIIRQSSFTGIFSRHEPNSY